MSPLNTSNSRVIDAAGKVSSQLPPGKIIAVTEYAESHQNSTGYFWNRAVTRLRQDGFQVMLVAHTIEMSPRTRANVFLRLKTKILVAARLARETIRHARRNDTVFVGTNPEILLPILAILCRMRGARLVVLIHDVFPENLIAAEVLKSGSMTYRLLRAVFSYIYSKFDTAIVIGRDMQMVVNAKAGREISMFIHNWVDCNDILPKDRMASGLIEQLGWQDKFVFQFFGNMGRLQNLTALLEALDLVTSDRAAFLFAGSGVMRSEIDAACANHPNRYALPLDHRFSRSEVLATCDASIVTLHPDMWGLGVPSKAYFSFAADRPVLAIMHPDSEVAMIVRDEQVGWVTSPDDIVSVARLIDEIAETGSTIASGRCRALAEGPLSSELALCRLSEKFGASRA